MIRPWLHALSIACLLLGATCAAVAAFDVRAHPQQMWIMNVVWPIAALYGGVAILWLYFGYGRLATRQLFQRADAAGRTPPSKTGTPFWIVVAKGANHCG